MNIWGIRASVALMSLALIFFAVSILDADFQFRVWAAASGAAALFVFAATAAKSIQRAYPQDEPDEYEHP